MRNESERQRIRQALEEATSGLKKNPFLYERVRAHTMEGVPAVKKKLSLSLVFALALAAVTLTGLAAGLVFGQEWYQRYRDGLAAADPGKYSAILEKLTTPVSQEATEHSLVHVTVQDASWVPEREVLAFTMRAVLKDPAHDELYPLWDLDPDGAYVGGDLPQATDGDSEDRADHWLWRHDGESGEVTRYGRPADVMDDPAKTLLLIEADQVLLNGAAATNSMDAIRLSDGSCMFYYECSLDWLDEAYDAQIAVRAQEHPERQAYYDQLVQQAQANRAALTSGSGLTCTVPYRVVALTGSTTDEELYLGGEPGSVTFTVTAQ